MRTAALHNLGCKVNAYETEAMRHILEEGGYTIVPFTESADVYVINTCSVTNIADRKSRQMIHRARRRNPEAVIVAAGCYVQAQTGGKSEDPGAEHTDTDDGLRSSIDVKGQPDFPGADIVIGNNRKHELLGRLDELFKNREAENPKHILETDAEGTETVIENKAAHVSSTVVDVIDINDRGERYEELPVTEPAEHTRAFIKVQDGCNQFCSYCIIPYVRGRARSRGMDSVIEEVKCLAAKGYREVVLTGIHLSSYGRDFTQAGTGTDDQLKQNCSLTDLIREVCRIDGIERVRLGSLEPGIVTENFAKELAALGKVCPHFHLSLQSGCDATLRRMNRKYTTEQYEDGCRILRKYFDDPAITTDVIVGFPGETEEEFAQTKEFVERIHFYEMHVFKYSRRKGTRADIMPDQIPEQVKARRSEELIALGDKMSREYRDRHIGLSREVLLEDEEVYDGRRYIVGYTPEYIKVAVEINPQGQCNYGDDGLSENDECELRAESGVIVTGTISGIVQYGVYLLRL